MKTNHGAVCPEVPAMIQDIEVIAPVTMATSPEGEGKEAPVPLCQAVKASLEPLYEHRLSQGRTVYVCARDHRVMDR